MCIVHPSLGYEKVVLLLVCHSLVASVDPLPLINESHLELGLIRFFHNNPRKNSIMIGPGDSGVAALGMAYN